MRVVVTGARGNLGHAVLNRLVELQHEVIGVDKRPIAHAPVPTVCVDLCQAGQVYGVLARADAVIHLGAIPSPWGLPPEVVYQNNVLSQFNVFEAASRLGIRRVVSASSVSALGFPFQLRWSEPLYLPIDEEHPLLPQDVYGLSKATGEGIAAAYCRRGEMSAVSLRFSTVVDQQSLPELLADVRRSPGDSACALWSYVDLRDVVEACVLALNAQLEGHHTFFITADDTTSAIPTDSLLDQWFPGVPRRPGARISRWSLLDCSRAATLLGYHPRYGWPENLQGNAASPAELRDHPA